MTLTRTLGCERAEVKGQRFLAVNNDCILEFLSESQVQQSLETRKRIVSDMEKAATHTKSLQGKYEGQLAMYDAEKEIAASRTYHPGDSIDMIVTSIPFGNQYEYSPSYHDLGHAKGDDEFFQQMDFLIPNLLRVLKPGRIAAIHVKDRVRFGKVTGKGMPTVSRFSDKTADAFEKHGFEFMARITIDTDVVRENNQTYRLGWSENAKDSSKMGAGMPEYVLVFRKLPSDTSDAYADAPVTKSKEFYMRSDWQIDAAGFWRSSGNRLPDPEILLSMGLPAVGRLWREHCLKHGYDHKEHVEIAKLFENEGRLPATFMLFAPISRNKDVWTDIARMKTLNNQQALAGKEKHVCPLQLDIIERLITRYSNPGEVVLDPFAGIFSVPYQALKMRRRAIGIELCADYWKFGVGYCEMVENDVEAPTLAFMTELEEEAMAPVGCGM
jgi:DNA modification methylase